VLPAQQDPLAQLVQQELQVQAEEHLDQRVQPVHLVRQEVLDQQDLQDQREQLEVQDQREPQVRKVRQELLAPRVFLKLL
jgi:hypothetical protein